MANDTIKRLKQIFDRNGNLPFDPYRCDRDDPRYQFLFDDDGNLQDGLNYDLESLVDEMDWYWQCHAVALYHSNNFAMNTKGNYTAIYYWR